MKFLEKNLEDIIWDGIKTPEGMGYLRERGLSLYEGRYYRQFTIPNYGIADLVLIRSAPGKVIDVIVYELKKGKVDIEGMMQLCRYMTGIWQHFNYHNNCHVIVSGVMIGRGIDKYRDFVFLSNIMDSISLVTFDYGMDGISFKTHEDLWVMPETEFHNDSQLNLKFEDYRDLVNLKNGANG